MEKQRTTKVVALTAMFLAIIGMTVAFAAMSQTLTIQGTAEMRTARWDVRFVTNTLNTTVSTHAELLQAPTLTATNLGTFEARLTRPGDSVVFTFDVTNAGDINARIGTLLRNGVAGGMPTCVGQATDPTDALADAALVCGNLVYTLTYTAGGATVAVDDTLTAGQTRNLTLRLAIPDTVTQQPTDDVLINGLGITIIYVQN